MSLLALPNVIKVSDAQYEVCWLLAADDFVLVSRLPEFEVQR
ncbi:MAG TPA: hypothetical protein VFM12_06345 [Gemmatimonadales bacterium]|nr:hypothetical protein [Gemmatimonadales bacterium]